MNRASVLFLCILEDVKYPLLKNILYIIKTKISILTTFFQLIRLFWTRLTVLYLQPFLAIYDLNTASCTGAWKTETAIDRLNESARHISSYSIHFQYISGLVIMPSREIFKRYNSPVEKVIQSTKWTSF